MNQHHDAMRAWADEALRWQKRAEEAERRNAELTRILDTSTERHLELERRLEEARALLRELQYGGDYIDGKCQGCGSDQGCAPDCRLRGVLGEDA